MSSFLILLPYLKDKNGNYLLDKNKIEEYESTLNFLKAINKIKENEIELNDIIELNKINDKELQKILKRKRK